MSILKRLPSFSLILEQIGLTVRRFPATVLCALAATVVAVIVADGSDFDDDPMLRNLFMAAALGVPLGVAIVLFAERRAWRAVQNFGAQAVGLLLLVGYYLALPPAPDPSNSVFIRFLLLALGLHFLVAFIPFVVRSQVQQFWEFNKSLFLRFLLAALYAAVLFVGIALALAAIDHLFGADIDDARYLQLWIILTALVHPLIFLPGVPRPATLTDSVPYPRGLKLFAQFILLPLVALYFVILIAYEIKIIVSWSWPTGWVAELILWYAVVGILSLLLLYPLRERSENKWVATFITWYFRASVPLIILLGLAIWVRIDDYGVTVNRYLVAAMAVGLVVVTGYFLFGRKKDIRVIPIVICLLAVLSAWGPWSAFSVSRSSQQGRLTEFMETHGLLQDGRLVALSDTIPSAAQREMSSIIRYLADYHDTELFGQWLSDSTLKVLDTLSRYQHAAEIATAIGLDYYGVRVVGPMGQRFYLAATPSGAIPISEYDYLLDLAQSHDYLHKSPANRLPRDQHGAESPQPRYTARLDSTAAQIEILRTDDRPGDPIPLLVLSLDRLTGTVRSRPNQSDVSAGLMMFDAVSDSLEARAVLSSVSGRYHRDSLVVESVNGYVLVREK